MPAAYLDEQRCCGSELRSSCFHSKPFTHGAPVTVFSICDAGQCRSVRRETESRALCLLSLVSFLQSHRPELRNVLQRPRKAIFTIIWVLQEIKTTASSSLLSGALGAICISLQSLNRERPQRIAPLCHSASPTRELSCRLSSFPQKPCGVSATLLFPEDIPRQGWNLPFQTQGGPAKAGLTQVHTGRGGRTPCPQAPSAPYRNEVNGMWQIVGFSFLCISFSVHELLAQPSLRHKPELTEGMSQLCKRAGHTHTNTAPNASLPHS